MVVKEARLTVVFYGFKEFKYQIYLRFDNLLVTMSGSNIKEQKYDHMTSLTVTIATVYQCK